MAQLNHEAACKLVDALAEIDGVSVVNETFFNEFVVELPKNASEVVEALAQREIIGGLALEGNQLLVAATELTTEDDVGAFVSALKEVC